MAPDVEVCWEVEPKDLLAFADDRMNNYDAAMQVVGSQCSRHLYYS